MKKQQSPNSQSYKVRSYSKLVWSYLIIGLLTISNIFSQTPDVWKGKILAEQTELSDKVDQLTHELKQIKLLLNDVPPVVAPPLVTCDNLCTKVIEIGDWNMDVTTTINIAHGLPDFTKIRTISAMIRNDNNLNYISLERRDIVGGSIDGIVDIINSPTIRLSRTVGGFFDNDFHDSTTFNRGWITIFYEQ